MPAGTAGRGHNGKELGEQAKSAHQNPADTSRNAVIDVRRFERSSHAPAAIGEDSASASLRPGGIDGRPRAALLAAARPRKGWPLC